MNKTLYNEAHLDEYIDLLVRIGINIRPGQQLVINSSTECAFFARKAMKAAFEAGASNVYVSWSDDICSRTKFLMADDGVFDNYPLWDKIMLDMLSEEGAAFLSISASDPEAFKGADSGRLSRWSIARASALKGYYEKVMSGKIRWCIGAAPSEAWAMKVFPDAGSSDEAVSLLWKNIFAATRVGGDSGGGAGSESGGAGTAAAKWKLHAETLKKRVAILNGHHFNSLHFKNSAGTDLHLELPERHMWQGGGDTAADGHFFFPNIPTEEIFSAPKADGVNGTVVGTMPNVFRGNLIEDFSITFKYGKVVAFDAKTGREHLANMVSDIKGMDRLGEIALVEHDSPISNTGILFYNTLFDENASCHLALGSAYPDCIEGGTAMSEDERRECGLNISDSHQDFMFGSKDMSITGIKAGGEEIPVFKDGCFVI